MHYHHVLYFLLCFCNCFVATINNFRLIFSTTFFLICHLTAFDDDKFSLYMMLCVCVYIYRNSSDINGEQCYNGNTLISNVTCGNQAEKDNCLLLKLKKVMKKLDLFICLLLLSPWI